MNLYGFAGGDPVNFSDPFGLWPDWKDIKDAGRQWIRHVKRNWDKLLPNLDPGDLTQGRQPKPEDIDPTPPPAEEAPAPNPGGAGSRGGGDGKKRLPGKDGKPGPEVKWDNIRNGIWDFLNRPRDLPQLPTVQPWMFPPILPGGVPMIVPFE